MNLPVIYEEVALPKSINRNAKFVMIGHNIDGFVNFHSKEFNNFEELQRHLPEILLNLRGVGEWDVCLYQVKETYKIQSKYGYYEEPTPSKLIFEVSYMQPTIRNVTFLKNVIILFHADVCEVFTVSHSNDIPKQLNVYVNRIKIVS